MTDAFSFSFAPVVPWPLLAALAVAGLLVIALGLFARRRGTWLRALGIALILAALTDPALVREDREPLKEVVAVVLDRSASQGIGERAMQTGNARAALEKALAAVPGIEARFIEAGRTGAEGDGTKLFAALGAGLADVPPERVGAVIMVTDGVVHDSGRRGTISSPSGVQGRLAESRIHV